MSSKLEEICIGCLSTKVLIYIFCQTNNFFILVPCKKKCTGEMACILVVRGLQKKCTGEMACVLVVRRDAVFAEGLSGAVTNGLGKVRYLNNVLSNKAQNVQEDNRCK